MTLGRLGQGEMPPEVGSCEEWVARRLMPGGSGPLPSPGDLCWPAFQSLARDLSLPVPVPTPTPPSTSESFFADPVSAVKKAGAAAGEAAGGAFTEFLGQFFGQFAGTARVVGLLALGVLGLVLLGGLRR